MLLQYIPLTITKIAQYFRPRTNIKYGMHSGLGRLELTKRLEALPPHVQIPPGALPEVVHLREPRRGDREVGLLLVLEHVLLATLPLHRRRPAGVQRAAPEREGRAAAGESSEQALRPRGRSGALRRRRPRRGPEAEEAHELRGVRHWLLRARRRRPAGLAVW